MNGNKQSSRATVKHTTPHATGHQQQPRKISNNQTHNKKRASATRRPTKTPETVEITPTTPSAPLSEELPSDHRHILINKPQPKKFMTNKVSTGKYSIFTFFPKFLFEQFRRASNIFFVSIIVMQLLPRVSPTGKYNTLIPLIFILAVSACKELIEDFKRHKADNSTNKRKTLVFKSGSTVSVTWMDVQVGDFVKVVNDEPFPADLLLLSSSENDGIAYIETANLDGETNLKIRQSLPLTLKFTDDKISHLTGYIVCDKPNRFIYEFLGKISLDTGGSETPLGPDQILLRGSKLKNTKWILGLVIYTGHETKLMKNASKVPLKRSTIEKITNKQIALLFLLLVAIATTCTSAGMEWADLETERHWYLPNLIDEDVSYGFFHTLMTFIILFNNLIPVSLTVTLEIVRFMQAKFIDQDLDMYYAPSDIPAVAKTSNLNDELGIIRYIFSDKTGTLTQNVMEFKGCSIGGLFYSPNDIGDGVHSPIVQRMKTRHRTAKEIHEFLVILSVCHTVIPDRSSGELVYHASSPDERALVLGASKYGFAFVSKTPNTTTISIDLGEEETTTETYEILNTLEFTSDRKRMSVIVRNPEKKIILFCKGADMMVFDRLSKDHNINSHDKKMLTQQHLDDFSKLGLRTLCLASRELTEEEYVKWNAEHHIAATTIKDHEKRIAEVEEKIETHLKLVGATAIEDKLQDEVPETIALLLQAGISMWMLTGDKQETAINIGRSCNLITANMQLFLINQITLNGTFLLINKHLDHLHEKYGDQLPSDVDAAVIIDGKTLHFATRKGVREDFITLCTSCRVVICCRASPFQKSEVVREVTRKTGKVTLSIGDGANDVAMIQKAHVGVGIAGVEGLQAASSADYAFGQFRYLRKLLMVHGAWNYNRISKVIVYCFYKNIFLYIMELWFAVSNGFSGQVIFDQWTISFYNMVFTAMQPLAIGIFEQNCLTEIRMNNPKLYVENQGGSFSMQVFVVWVAMAFIHAVIIYLVGVWIVGTGVIWGEGRDGGFLVLGNIIYSYVVIVASLKAGIELKSWVVFAHVSIWVSIVLWFTFLPVYDVLTLYLPLNKSMFGISRMVYSSVCFWLGIPIIILICFVPELCYHALINTLRASSEHERLRQEHVAILQRDSRDKLVHKTKSVITHIELQETEAADGPPEITEISRTSINSDHNVDINSSGQKG